jgi:hypothetical protein
MREISWIAEKRLASLEGHCSMENNWVHSACRPPIGLLYLPRMIMRMENLVEWWLTGETEVLGENLPQCHFVHHKSHMTWSGASPGRRGGKPASSRSSYGTAMKLAMTTVFYDAVRILDYIELKGKMDGEQWTGEFGRKGRALIEAFACRDWEK